MKLRTNWVLLAIIVVLLGYIGISEWHSRQRSQAEGETLGRFDLDKVDEVRFTVGGETATVVREADGRWRLTHPFQPEADGPTMLSLLTNLKELQPPPSWAVCPGRALPRGALLRTVAAGRRPHRQQGVAAGGHREKFDRCHIVNEGDWREAVRKTQAYLDTQPEDQGKVSRSKRQRRTKNKDTDKKRTK